MEKSNKGLYYKLLILTAIAIPLLLSFSYAYFLAVVEGTENPTNMAGTSITGFNFNLVTENNGYISASGIIPITSSQVETDSNKAHFKVITGNNQYFVIYSLSLTDIEMDSDLKISDFKWELICTNCRDNSKNASGSFNGLTSNTMILNTNLSISSSSEDQYELRIWLNDNGLDQTTLLNKSFSAKVTATGEFGSREF